MPNRKVKPKVKAASHGERVIAYVSKGKKDNYYSLASQDILLGDVKRFIPTKLGYLDDIFGGGIPCGRIIEFAGKYSIGKSAIAEFIGHKFQEQDGVVVYYPFEPSLQKKHLKSYKIKLDDFIIGDVPSVEDAFEDILKIIKYFKKVGEETGEIPPVLFVWDSVSASTTYAELQKDEKGTLPAALARAFSKSIRKIRRQLAKIGGTLILINQKRHNIGGFGGFGFDNSMRPGGEAIKHSCEIMSTMKKIKTLKRSIDGKDVKYGYRIRLITDKNHINGPHQEAEFILTFTRGIDPVETLLEIAREKKIVKPTGSRLKFEDESYTRGELYEHFENNFDKLYALIIQPKKKKKKSKKKS